MRPNGPQGRYAPLRGTQRAVVAQLRHGDWCKGVPALAAVLACTEAQVWRALVCLTDRRLVVFVKRENDYLRLWLTRSGCAIRL